MKKRFMIMVSETVSKSVCVDAEDEHAARMLAGQMYDRGEIDMSRCVNVEFHVSVVNCAG